MEPKFVNQFPVSFELYKEWANHPVGSKATKNRKKSLSLRIGGCALSVIIIVLGALSGEFYAVLMGAAFLALFLARLFYLPNRILKKRYDLITGSLPGNQLVMTYTFSENIVIEDGRNTSKFEYQEMLKASEDEKNFYLFINADTVLRILKSNFILGSSEDFRSFINNAVTNKAGCIEPKVDDLGL